MAEDAWASYFYPETYDPRTGRGTLRNLFDERDPEVLRRLEYQVTARRARAIAHGQVLIEATFDLEHLRAIHAHLFRDVYDWAGQVRRVDIVKDRSEFASISGGGILRYTDAARDVVQATQWSTLDASAFAAAAAVVFAHVNQAHPFREGNGRTGKVYMDAVAAASGFALDWAAVSPAVWNQASMLSGPDRGGWAVHPRSLVPVFAAMARGVAGSEPTGGTSAIEADPERVQGLRERLEGSRPPRPPGRGGVGGQGSGQDAGVGEDVGRGQGPGAGYRARLQRGYQSGPREDPGVGR